MAGEKRLKQTRPESKFLERLSSPKIFANVVFVGYLLLMTAWYQLAPNSLVGELLHEWYGLILVAVTGYALVFVCLFLVIYIGKRTAK
jgi:hypothetical protein